MLEAGQETPPPGAAAGAAGLRFGGFAFDPGRGVLRQPDGTETVLRPKPADLLHHLARHATQVVGRDALMDAVWPGVVVTDDSITQCVAEIRRALGAEGAALLRTLPKRGYLLDAAVTRDAARPPEAAPPPADAAGDAAAVRPSGGAVPPSHARLRRRSVVWLGAGLGMAGLAGTLAWLGAAPRAMPPQPLPAMAGAGATTAPEPAGSVAARRRTLLVLPFTDAGGDPVPGGLADGITEELIAGFGGVYNFTVIGRGTAFAYRGRPTELRQLGRDLGVRYVLDGTLRRFGTQVLVSIHLQDTGSGSQIWADRFEMPLADPAGLPRLVFARIQRNLTYALNAIESRQAPVAGANRPDATDLLIRGDAAWNRRSSPEAMAATRALYAQAVALDESSTAAHTALGGILVVTAFDGHSADREADLAEAERHLALALALNPQNSMAHYWRGLALRLRWRFDEALAEYDLLVAVNRNVARAIGARGGVMLVTDRLEQAIAESREAIRISPNDPGLASWLAQIGSATRRLGREEEALGHYIRAASLDPTDDSFLGSLASLYALLGRDAEAAAALREWRQRRPGLTVDMLRRAGHLRSPYPGWRAGLERYLEGLRLAGMPEE